MTFRSSVCRSLCRKFARSEAECHDGIREALDSTLWRLKNRQRDNGVHSEDVMKEQAEHKINLIEDADASGELAQVYDEWRAHSGRQQMPGILKCFSHRPDFLRQVMAFSNGVHFSKGHLDRKTKEAIASYVSYLNRCPY